MADSKKNDKMNKYFEEYLRRKPKLVHKIECFIGIHFGYCYDGAFRCAYCSYIDRYR